MADIDWDDPLLASPKAKAVATHTPVLERARDVFSRLNTFYEAEHRLPVSEMGRSVQERLLANDLAGLRASRSLLAELAPLDVHGLVFDAPTTTATSSPFDDPLLGAAGSIFELSRPLQEKARPDYIADRMPCPDFHRFEPMFERVRQAVEERTRVPRRFRQERVEQGEVFSLNGQLVFVADIRDHHDRNGRPDARLRVVYDNATESNLLMSSLIRALQKDEGGARIAVSSIGPLFDRAVTGFVYVVRSRSEKPEVEGLLKIGTTKGAVEDRVSRADTQAAFLFAPVQILDTYELIGHSAEEAEQMLHKALRQFHVALRVTAPDGRPRQATEWFRIDRETIASLVGKLFGSATRSSD